MTEGHARKRNKGRHDHRGIGYRLRKCGIFKKIVDDINTIRYGKHVKNCALQKYI